ncbi:MAG: DUF262 domain-containing protein [Mariprofundaceae bacterium]|nr:DUF262 domain-containing protein [Mariprofundaceae bacterium]
MNKIDAATIHTAQSVSSFGVVGITLILFFDVLFSFRCMLTSGNRLNHWQNANMKFIEETADGIRENESDITNPFSTKDIKITNAQILLPSLIRRLDHDEIDLNPDFQRHANLWDLHKMSRLIESILLKLPLPVFYFNVSNPDKWIVVDGLQRLIVSLLKKISS